MKRLIPFLALVLLAVVVYGLVRDHQMQSNFAAIQPKATEQAVLSSLGKPSSIDRSCSAYGTHLSQNCDHVLIYKSFFLIPERYWLIFFDSSDLATATSRQAKP